MAALNVNGEALAGVAAALVAAGQSLTSLAGAPLAHPAVAPDEVSTSAATRLTAHGATLQSRASDGAQVLNSAARAVLEAVRAYTDMDIANTSLVALSGGAAGATGASFTPAVTTNAQTASVPIATPVPRYGKITAAMMEAGNSSAGSGFTSGCNSHAGAYEQAATAARNAENMVREALTGEAGPKLGAALDRFAAWADQMASHARTVGSAAQSHQQRFQQARQSTPATNDFSQTEQQLLKAQQLESRYPGSYGPVIVKLQDQLGKLQRKTTHSLSNYHLGELPAAPPPPPPVVPIVTGSGQPQQARQGAAAGEGRSDRDAASGRGVGAQEAAAGARSQSGGAESGDLEGLGGESGEALDGGDELADLGLGGPGMPGGDMSQQMGPMMQALPQALGGILGAVTALPAAAAQAVQQGASQLMQGASGLADGLKTDPESELPTTGLGGGADGLGAGAGGGGGGTEPAAAPTDLSPSSGGMMAMGAPAPSAPPLVGATGANPGAQAAAGPGGAPMPMAPMGGMGMGGAGGAGARPVKDPDKKVYLPEEPNTEAVRGDVQRRHQAVAEDVLGENKSKPTVTVSSRSTKRVVQADEAEGEQK